jgi:hypothetical protein
MLLCFRVVLCTVPACPTPSPPSHHNRLPQRGVQTSQELAPLAGREVPQTYKLHLVPTRKYSFQRDGLLKQILASMSIQFSDGATAAGPASSALVAGSIPGGTVFGFFVFCLSFSRFCPLGLPHLLYDLFYLFVPTLMFWILNF